MNKIYRNAISVGFLIGVLYWIFDAIWDKYVLLSDRPLYNILVYDVPYHYYQRLYAIMLLIISGVFGFIFLMNYKEKGRLYCQLLEYISNAIFIQSTLARDDFKTYIEVNNAACQMLGYTRDELLQLPIHKILDQKNLDDFVSRMALLSRKKHVNFETVFLKKDGSKVPVEVKAYESQFKGEPISIAVVQDISASLAAKEALQKSDKNISVLTDRIVNIREEEQCRLAKELHDELGQDLLYLQMEIHWLEKNLPKEMPDIKKRCENSLHYLMKSIENVKRLLQDLKPDAIESLGFNLGTNLMIRDCCKHYGIKSVSIDADEIDDLLSSGEQLNLYRIFQESLTNIGKHAQATEVSVTIKRLDGQLHIKIKDNGKGYDPVQAAVKNTGIGLSNLKERVQALGGQLKIQSRPGKGTENSLIIPMNRQARIQRGDDHGSI